MDKTIRLYLKCLETGDSNKILNLFARDATVHSPLRGIVNASEFYKDLFSNTRSSRISLLNIFNSENTSTAAAHFRYYWVLKDGTPKSFECVDVFDFDEEGKIKRLTIIYDTYDIRGAYERVRNK